MNFSSTFFLRLLIFCLISIPFFLSAQGSLVCQRQIDFSNFESGWGIWEGSGVDSYRINNSDYSNGDYSVILRDNSSSSEITSQSLHLNNYERVDISFSFISRRFDPGNSFSFFVSTDGGANYQELETWEFNVDFQNETRYNITVVYNGPMSKTVRFRFVSNAENNFDLLYIDDIRIEGCLIGSGFCSAPSNVQFEPNTTTSGRVSWNGSSNAQSYLVRYRVAGTVSWTNRQTSGNETFMDLTGLMPNTLYEVEVASNCSNGVTSSFSNDRQFNTTPPCSEPSNIDFAPNTTTSGRVSWNGTSDASSYSVRYRVAGSGSWTNLQTTSDQTFVDLTGLLANTLYEVEIASNCSNGGTSSFSGDVQFIITSPSVTCEIPSDVEIVTGETAIEISFGDDPPSTDRVFQIDYRKSGSTTWSTVIATSAATVLVENLDATTTYEYRVKAICGSDQSEYSDTDTFSTIECVAPDGIYTDPTYGDLDDIKVYWNEVDDVKSYFVKYRKQGDANFTTVEVTEAMFALDNIDVGVIYEIQVAINCLGSISTYSSSVFFTTAGTIYDCNILIDSNDFETDWGIWNDGGLDAFRYKSQRYNNGQYSILLRDNSNSSNITSDPLDLSGVSAIQIDFYMYTLLFENSTKGIVIEILEGDNVREVLKYRYFEDFLNLIRYENNSVNISGPFSSETRIRFRTFGTDRFDFVFFDDIEIYACGAADDLVSLSAPKLNTPAVAAPSTDDLNLKVFPNPARDVLNINFSKALDTQGLLKVLDLNGRIMFQQKVNVADLTSELNISTLKSGMYYLQLTTDSEQFTEGFIKN